MCPMLARCLAVQEKEMPEMPDRCGARRRCQMDCFLILSTSISRAGRPATLTRTFAKNTRLFPELRENDDAEEPKVDGMYSSSKVGVSGRES